ncbi:type II toxin-antitoxin system RelE/ParE family toxin [Mucilaginibacter ginkgonis]|uniref:Plasmid stabilization system protein ParE n=1 Tax=Mucilaginibacter ginkgonis TaxID=2682091 RepID=A0A6I4HZL3_9SPHI|nr:hypothetical protein [Mucilaginibacter ginkgonis]QQL48876.1 hypothetical protein GO620_011880 [Mucilaginibacter ginkgonis]
MGLKIEWSPRAEFTYNNILLYLELNWSANDVDNFMDRTDMFLKAISEQPDAFPQSKISQVRKAVITKQNSLFYSVRKSGIYLITFWDNRMSPDKNPYHFD